MAASGSSPLTWKIGRLHAARDVGGIRRRARFVGQRGEADLVVDDQVDGAAGGVAVELRQVQRLGHHALAGERRVAVDQHRNHALALGIAEPVLLGAHDAFHHRIHGFQVARIRRHGDHDLACRSTSCGRRRAQVILHVARALRADGSMSPSNSEKICCQRLADDVGQHVQAAAMRHADRRSRGRRCAAARSSNLVQDRDRGLAAFQRESLLADEAGVQEVLELLGLDQPVQNAHRGSACRAAIGLASGSMRSAASASAPAPGYSCTRRRSCRIGLAQRSRISRSRQVAASR